MKKQAEAPSLVEQQAQLDALKRVLAAQDATLERAREQADPRADIVVSAAARERFEARCVPALAASRPASGAIPGPVRC